ncbi:hypothetical protein AVEN_235209-1, partial [Araneus ventricosus]
MDSSSKEDSEKISAKKMMAISRTKPQTCASMRSLLDSGQRGYLQHVTD